MRGAASCRTSSPRRKLPASSACRASSWMTATSTGAANTCRTCANCWRAEGGRPRAGASPSPHAPLACSERGEVLLRLGNDVGVDLAHVAQATERHGDVELLADDLERFC